MRDIKKETKQDFLRIRTYGEINSKLYIIIEFLWDFPNNYNLKLNQEKPRWPLNRYAFEKQSEIL